MTKIFSFKKFVAASAAGTLALASVVIPTPSNEAAAADQFVNASLEMSTSAPSTVADWTITIEVYNAISTGDEIVINASAGGFTVPAGITNDIAASNNGSALTMGTEFGTIAVAADVITLPVIGAGFAADDVLVFKIGAHAGGDGDQIESPAKVGPAGDADILDVVVTSQGSGGGTAIDTITFKVPIIESVQNTSSSSPDLTMWILPGDADQYGSGVTVSSTAISWGQVTPSTPLNAQLEVGLTTNAQAGFTVFLHQESAETDGNMVNTENDTYYIDAFPGSNDNPVAWEAEPIDGTDPTGARNAFLGYNTSDTDLVPPAGGSGATNRFDTAENGEWAPANFWAGLNTDPAPVLSHDQPVNNGRCGAKQDQITFIDTCEFSGSSVNGEDFALVTLQLETGTLQPSGNYANTLIFTAKPVF